MASEAASGHVFAALLEPKWPHDESSVEGVVEKILEKVEEGAEKVEEDAEKVEEVAEKVEEGTKIDADLKRCIMMIHQLPSGVLHNHNACCGCMMHI